MGKNLWLGIKLIVSDFDGCWTDGKVTVHQDGSESVVCSRKDTLRLPEVRALGIDLLVLSTESNTVVLTRCTKMEVPCIIGCRDKLPGLRTLLESRKLHPAQVAYVGDDLNDLDCLRYVGLPITVADGDEKCRAIARLITTRRGGDHAMREIFDLLLASYENP